MAGTLIISLGILAYFIIFAWTDIQTMMGTVYPGSRFETGGDYTINQFIAGYTNIFYHIIMKFLILVKLAHIYIQ